jgi:WD40 repeat protein
VPRIGACLVALLVAGVGFGQRNDTPEAFAFDPKPTTLQPALPFWWNVAVSPDGATIVTAHGLERGGEWWVWDAKTGAITAKVAEPNTVRFICFSPDGSLLATANFDNAIRIYDAKTHKLIAYGHQATGGHTGGVNAIAFSGDGAILASAGLDKTARVWNVAEAVKRQRAAEGNPTVTMSPRIVFEGFEQSVFSVALSPDGKKLVTGGQDGSVRLFNVPAIKEGQTIRVKHDTATKLTGHGITVECVAFSPDGKRIASGSWDNTARLYDADGKEIAVLKGHNRGIMAMAFSRDGKLLATCSGDHTANIAGEVRLWDADDGKDRGLVGKQEDMALGVAFGPTDGNLVSVGRDRAVRVWDVEKRAQVHTLRPADAAAEESKVVQALAYSPDGSLLAVGGEGGTIDLWTVKERKKVSTLNGHKDTVYALAWSSDGSRLVSGSGDRTAIIWDMGDKKPIRTLKHAGGVFAVAITRDGKTVASGGFDKIVRLWDAESGVEKAKREGHTASIRCLAFAPEGELFASGGSDYSVRIWNQNDEKESRALRGHTKTVRALAYLPDGSLVTGGDDRLVRVWAMPDGEPRHTFGPFNDAVLSVAASPRGSFVVGGLATGPVHVCDPREGLSRAMLTGPTEGTAAVAIAPDGLQVATAGYDRTVRLWTSGTSPSLPTLNLAGHDGPVRSTAVSPDGSLIATGGKDGTIRLWDSASGVERGKWSGHEGSVDDLSFSRDGKLLVSGGEDKAAKVWQMPNHELAKTYPQPSPVRRVALSEKGTLVAVAIAEPDVRLFRIDGDEVFKKLNAEGQVIALQFLADDLLLTGAGSRAYLWDVKDGRVMETLDGGQFARVTAAAGTNDAKLFAIAGDPAPGTQMAKDAGFCRVMTVSRHHPTTTTQRMNDTGVGVTRLSVSPDARMVAAVGGDGTVRMWEWPTLTTIRKFPSHGAAVTGLAMSSRGEFLVTASADGTAKRWTASRGEPLVYAARLLDESKQAWFARVSPDGKVLATGGDDGKLRLRESVPGAYRTLPGDYQYTFSTAISNDGTILATGHLDGAIQLWDLKTGKPIRKLEGHANRVWSIAFSPDGTRMVSGAGRWEENVAGEIRVWDTATWKAVQSFGAHDDLVFAVAVSPDNKTIASGSRDQTLRTWELATGKPIHTMQQGGWVRNLAYARDGKRIYVCGNDGQLRWWDPMKATQEGSHAFANLFAERLQMSPDGKFLGLSLRTNNRRYSVGLWSVEKNELVRQFRGDYPAQINCLAFSPDGRTLATGGGHYQTNPRFQAGPVGPWVMTAPGAKDALNPPVVPVSDLRCWDVETGNPLAELPGPKHWLEAVQFTRDGKELVTAGGIVGQPVEIRLWDTAGLRPKSVLASPSGSLTCGRFNPDGTLFATGTTTGAVVVWEVAKAMNGDASAKKLFKGHKQLVRNLAWSMDGTRVVTSGEDGTVRVWDPVKGEEVLHIAAHNSPIYGVAVSPDGTMIATAAGDWKNKAKGEVRVWDAVKGTELFRLPTHEFSAWGVAFTSDGKLVTAHQEEAAVRVFDVATRKELKTLTSPTAARGLALSPDGKWLGITAQTTGLVKVWELGTWREAHEVSAHPGKVVFTIDFAPDKQTVLTAGGDGAAVVWKLPGGTWKLPDYVPPAPKVRPAADGLRKGDID